MATSANESHHFPNLHTSLVSVGQLCDNGCEAIFTKDKAIITKANDIILEAPRNPNTGLWHYQPSNHPMHHQCNFIQDQHTNLSLVEYYHATAGYPVPATWLKAITKGHYMTWPGLTHQLVSKYLPKSIITAKGHQHRRRKNLQSTKDTNHTTEDDHHPLLKVTKLTSSMQLSLTSNWSNG